MDPVLGELIGDQGMHLQQAHPGPLSFMLTNGWMVLVAMFLVYHVWKNIYFSIAAARMRNKEEGTANVLKKGSVPVDEVKREQERMAAVEKLQRRYNENILKMKEVEEEKEKMKRGKYASKLSEISPGRKLNESCDDNETGKSS